MACSLATVTDTGYEWLMIDADHLLADRGYESNAIVEQTEKQGMEAVIPPKKNRKIQRPYDKELYKLRHLVENAFLHLKRWRGIATRYAKNTSSFLAAVQIRCIALWVDIPRSVRIRMTPIPCSAKNGSTRLLSKSADVIGVLVVYNFAAAHLE